MYLYFIIYMYFILIKKQKETDKKFKRKGNVFQMRICG